MQFDLGMLKRFRVQEDKKENDSSSCWVSPILWEYLDAKDLETFLLGGGDERLQARFIMSQMREKQLLPASLFDTLLRRGCCASASGYPCYADYFQVSESPPL